MPSISYPRRLALVLMALVATTVGLSACDPSDADDLARWYALNPVEGRYVTAETMNEPQRAVLAALADRQAQEVAFYEGIVRSQQGPSLHPTLLCIRHHESDRGSYPYDDGYQADNPYSSASGAYQFIDSTWRNVSGRFGYPGYSRARYAPVAVQDAVALATLNAGGGSAWSGTGCAGT